MDTKTRREEALALLALDEIIGDDAIRLNILTARQAGVHVVQYSEGTFGLEDAKGVDFSSWENHYSVEEAWEDTPDYVTSVDACLTLPLPKARRMVISYAPAAAGVWLWVVDIYHGWDDQGQAINRSLAIAILKAWWQLQPE